MLVKSLLQAVQPYLPPCGSHQHSHLSKNAPHLLQLFIMISKTLEQTQANIEALSTGLDDDAMDLDGFSPQKNQSAADGSLNDIPRQDLALDASPVAFTIEVTERLMFIEAMEESHKSLGSVPSTFIENLLKKPVETLISCRRLLLEIFASDLILIEADAAKIVERLGECLDVFKMVSMRKLSWLVS